MPAVRVHVFVWAVLVLAVGVLAASVQLGSATTLPSSTLNFEVLVTPKTVIVGRWATSSTHDGQIEVGGPIPRGDYLKFSILNRGKRVVAFSAFGKTIAAIKPGSIGHFNVLALRRGKFPYTTKINGVERVRGVFLVA
jgi:hypothetical protein